MNQQIPRNTVFSDEANTLSHSRQTLNKYGQQVVVPVIDVRDGVVERMIIEGFIKSTNRSKFINYTEYHRSHKKRTNI